MQFNSYLFIQLLPAFIILYFLLNKINQHLGKLLIILAGMAFYAYGGIESFLVLCISVIYNFGISLWISKIKKGKKALLAFSITVNILILLYYKYSNFALTTINDLLGKEFNIKKLVLPLGISFFTFQQIMYVVTVFREEVKSINVFDYLAYVLYFPKLVMGPLIEPNDFITQLNDRGKKKINWDNLVSGTKLFSFGLFKKMLLADTFAKGVGWGFANLEAATAGDLYLVMLFYTFEIYFDFSGYSDMAVGVSKMINITLPMNFDSPYKALSIRDFWKRWHISLTNFLTRYVYFPLGGSKRGIVRTYVNIMIIFLISGLWHGANWTFILWGSIYGILMVMERVFKKHLEKKENSGAKWLGTFIIVNILWLLFRSETIAQWGELLSKMFSFQNMEISEGLIQAFILPESSFLIEGLGLENLNQTIRGLSMLTFVIASFIICLIPENNYRNSDKNGIINMVLCAVAFVWAFLCLSSESVFVYFNF